MGPRKVSGFMTSVVTMKGCRLIDSMYIMLKWVLSLWGNEAKIYSLKLYGFVSSGYSLDLWLSVHIDNLIWIRVIWKTNLWTYQWGNSVLDAIEENPPCNCGLHCFMYSVSEWRKMTKPTEQHNFFLSVSCQWELCEQLSDLACYTELWLRAI